MRSALAASILATLAILAVTPVAGGEPAQSSSKRFTGYLWNLDEKRVRCAGQGNYHGLVLIDHDRESTGYKLRLTGPGGLKNVWKDRTNQRGRGETNASRWVNDVAGTGMFEARWRKNGRRIAAWDFRVIPEFGSETCP